MNLPFVPRRAYDRAITASVDANARAFTAEVRMDLILDTLRAERERYDTLLDQFARLKAQGATVEPKPVELGSVPALRVDPLADVIDELAGSDYRKRALMLRQLRADRHDRLSDDEIERRMRTGTVLDEGVPA